MALILLGAAFGLIMVVGPAVAQEQTATTADGKVVILKSDGTWEFAEGALRPSGTPEVRLPITKASEELAVTLRDVRRTTSYFNVPLREGSTFLVVSYLYVQGRGGLSQRLIDANDNVLSQCGGAATSQGPEVAFCLPTGRQVKAFRIGPLEFDLTSVTIR